MTSPQTTAELSSQLTADLHMVRCQVDLRAFNIWAGTRRLIRRDTFDPGFAMHCLLAESFGDLAPKPFRYIVPRGRGQRKGVLYGYCRNDAGALRKVAQTFADPLQLEALTVSRLATKPMPSDWNVDQRLGFEIRLRPVARTGRGSCRPGSERDVFQLEAQGHPPGGMSRTREDVYSDWLADQFRRLDGAELIGAQLRAFERTRDIRGLNRPTVEGPAAVLTGDLTVTEVSGFNRLLSRGVGRHRAYGYGMLLLRPPSRSRTP